MAGKRLVKGSAPVGRSAEAWALARRQHGVLRRLDLLGLGFTSTGVEYRLASGRLHRVTRGVYAVGRPELSREGCWMSAVLACGEGAALGHRSAAALWGIGSERAGWVDVSVTRHCSMKPRSLSVPGSRRKVRLRVRSRPALRDECLASRLGIPVTTPVQTLVDLATELPDNWLERAVNEADKHDLVDPEALRDALDERSGEPGVPRLRRILDRHTFRLSDSDLEIFFRPIAAEAGLPPPLTKQFVNGFEVDFHFPDLGLVVETDGWRYHRTPAQQTRAALRDQAHTASGLTPLRFSHWQIAYEADYVCGILAETNRRIRARGGAGDRG